MTTKEMDPGGDVQDKGETVVLQVQLHCRNCSNSVVKCLNHFPGVEEVITNLRNNKVIIKGDKIDPKTIVNMFKNKCTKHVHIMSPKLEQITQRIKIDQVVTTKYEVKVIHAILDIYIHCQNCGNSFKERLLKMKGVNVVEVDMEKSQVKVEGIFEANKLVEYVVHRMGKQVTAITTFMVEDVIDTPIPSPKPKKKQMKRQVVDDGPKIVYTTSNHSCDLFPQPEYHGGMFLGCQLFSDEYSHSCSIM